MGAYIVERVLPGMTPEGITAAAQAAKDTSKLMRDEGATVTYAGSTFIPEGDRCICLFDADSAATVIEVNERASLPYERVLPAAHIDPGDLG